MAITTQGSQNIMTGRMKDETKELAKLIYVQRTRLSIPDEELPQVARDCFKEAEIFVREAAKIEQEQNPQIDLNQIIALLRTGNKINAIKDYRAMTGLGLKEAKDYIDGLEQWINKNPIVAQPLPAPKTTLPNLGPQQGLNVWYGQTGQVLKGFDYNQIYGGVLSTPKNPILMAGPAQIMHVGEDSIIASYTPTPNDIYKAGGTVQDVIDTCGTDDDDVPF